MLHALPVLSAILLAQGAAAQCYLCGDNCQNMEGYFKPDNCAPNSCCEYESVIPGSMETNTEGGGDGTGAPLFRWSPASPPPTPPAQPPSNHPCKLKLDNMDKYNAYNLFQAAKFRNRRCMRRGQACSGHCRNGKCCKLITKESDCELAFFDKTKTSAGSRRKRKLLFASLNGEEGVTRTDGGAKELYLCGWEPVAGICEPAYKIETYTDAGGEFCDDVVENKFYGHAYYK